MMCADKTLIKVHQSCMDRNMQILGGRWYHRLARGLRLCLTLVYLTYRHGSSSADGIAGSSEVPTQVGAVRNHGWVLGTGEAVKPQWLRAATMSRPCLYLSTQMGARVYVWLEATTFGTNIAG